MEPCCTDALQSKLLCHSRVWWISLCSWRLWTILSENCWTVWSSHKFMGNDACDEHLQNQFWCWSFEWMPLCSRWANVLHSDILGYMCSFVFFNVLYFNYFNVEDDFSQNPFVCSNGIIKNIMQPSHLKFTDEWKYFSKVGVWNKILT